MLSQLDSPCSVTGGAENRSETEQTCSRPGSQAMLSESGLFVAPSPLCTVSEKHTPPEGRSDERHRSDTAETSKTADSEPRSLSVQTRGVTSQKEKQTTFSQSLHRSIVAMKLRTAGLHEDAEKLDNCHSTWTFQVCNGCSTVKKFANRCDNFFCPECQPGLARARAKAVQWWTIGIAQPKHIVLTVKNVPDLTKAHVKQFKRWWATLRRRKFAKNWTGGFYALEVTNEGNGWHLHLHALIDSRWICQKTLVEQWQDITGNAGRICYVKDCRKSDYLKEVTKYAVKGSELAAWSPEKIARFVEAFRGVRTFGVFGSLYGKRTAWKEWIQSQNAQLQKCNCGCSEFRYYDEHQWLMLDLKPVGPICSRPPPQLPDLQVQFDLR